MNAIERRNKRNRGKLALLLSWPFWAIAWLVGVLLSACIEGFYTGMDDG